MQKFWMVKHNNLLDNVKKSYKWEGVWGDCMLSDSWHLDV